MTITRKPLDGQFVALMLLAVVVLIVGIMSGNWFMILVAVVCAAIALMSRRRLP